MGSYGKMFLLVTLSQLTDLDMQVNWGKLTQTKCGQTSSWSLSLDRHYDITGLDFDGKTVAIIGQDSAGHFGIWIV